MSSVVNAAVCYMEVVMFRIRRTKAIACSYTACLIVRQVKRIEGQEDLQIVRFELGPGPRVMEVIIDASSTNVFKKADIWLWYSIGTCIIRSVLSEGVRNKGK